MRTYKKEYRKVPDKLFCDVCGTCCSDDNCGDEFALLEALWGYCSKKDGSRYAIHLCENCFDKTITYLKTLKYICNYHTEDNPLNGMLNPV